MAKKKRKEEAEEEEKYEFVPPDFDEKGFLEKDIKGTKALMVSSLLGIVFGILAFALTGVSIFIGLAVIIVGIVALRFIYPLFRIEYASLERKTLIGNYVLMFFLALGIWIVLLNLPFSDNQNPEVLDQAIFFQQGGVWKEYVSAGSTPISAGDLTNITVQVRDNGRLASVQIQVYPSSGSPGGFVDMENTGTYGSYQLQDTYSANQYLYKIRVTDGAGHITETAPLSFTVVP